MSQHIYDQLHAERLDHLNPGHRPRKAGLDGVKARLNRLLLRAHRDDEDPVFRLQSGGERLQCLNATGG